MLHKLELHHVGPVPELVAEFAPRLNVITGDNGLGKSFLLDIAWWALTRKWPRDLNKLLTSGEMARPNHGSASASIDFSMSALSTDVAYRSKFSNDDQAWTGRAGRPSNPGLVVYAMADGSFSVWDPARNYWRKKGNLDVQDRMPAYVFSPRDVWDGLVDPDRGLLCNGLIADWASWQKENGDAFKHLCLVLEKLSPDKAEPIVPGKFVRISLDDPRDIPTLKMPYGVDVPVLYASSGMKRIIALAYLLVWTWQEHIKASALLQQPITPQMVFLIDEVECHLHPRWQRCIVGALLEVMSALSAQAKVQAIIATHSPLVMASIEPRFDVKLDAWFDLDLVSLSENSAPSVQLKKRDFLKLGEASRWLMSDAFDLASARSLEAEAVLERASLVLSTQHIDHANAKAVDAQLRKLLGDTDPFWARWRYVGEKQGWLT